jgi:hypothetical protein
LRRYEGSITALLRLFKPFFGAFKALFPRYYDGFKALLRAYYGPIKDLAMRSAEARLAIEWPIGRGSSAGRVRAVTRFEVHVRAQAVCRAEPAAIEPY